MTRDDLASAIAAIPDPLERARAAELAIQVYGPAAVRRARIAPMVEYQHDPVGFIVRELGVPEETLRWSLLPEYRTHTWDGTHDPLAAICESVAAGKDTGVESGTGTGKTFLGAAIVLWFLAAFEDAFVITVAPKEEQLLLHCWKEIGRQWPKFAALRVARYADLMTSGEIRIRGHGDRSWYATAFTAGVAADESVATKAKGFHAEHMLFVFEETPGIPDPIMEAIENTCTGAHNLRLAFGNPDNAGDALHRFCISPDVVHVRVSALDHPNVVTGRELVPGAVTQKSIDYRLKKYRSEDARLYLTQVRGISPEEATDSLIRMAWCRAAAARYDDPRYRVGAPALGVDVANSEAGDKGALAFGRGNALLDLTTFACPDASLLGVRVALMMALHRIAPKNVGVDSVGVGASTVNKLKELKRFIQALNGGEKPWPSVDEERHEETGQAILPEELHRNLRAQMYWQMRVDLEHDRIALPPDEDLFRELTIVRYETKNGVIHVTPKEEIKDLLGRSPDKADAAVYWNFVRRRRPLPKKEEQRSAFDPETLKSELEQRRVRAAPPPPKVDPMVLVTIDE